MSKKTNSIKNSVPADFSWAKDSVFTPPPKKEGTAAYKTFTPAASRVGDLKPLLEEFLSTLISTVKATAGIVRISPPPHGQTPQIISSVGFPAELLEVENIININCESFGKAAIGRGLYSANLGACKTRHDCRNIGCQIQSIIAASLESPNSPGNQIGILTLFFDTPQEPSEHVSTTVRAFTKLLGAIVEHNRSNSETKRIDLIAERQSIANEIHDSLAQTLVYTRMRTSLLLESIRAGNELMSTKYAHDIDDALEISQKTVRELITDFRCAMDPSGLPHALQTLTEQFCLRNNIALEYINRAAELELPLEYEIQVYHIVQEALANIATHSGATHARLIVDFTSGYYIFTVKDNGSGGCTFTPVEGHYGMMIMRERAQRIGGEIKLESSKGFGTHVQLFFPKPGSDWRAVNEYENKNYSG
ncbi:MAG: histidine kinase [Gallionella sp.]|nr:histidine kinase [Gallionella sp.]